MTAARGLSSMPRNWWGSTVCFSSYQEVLVLAQVPGQFDDLAFQALHVLHGDVEEVAGAAGRVEDAGGAQLFVEGADFVQGGGRVVGQLVGHGGGLDVLPVVAQRLDQGRQDQALDEGAGREVGAQLVALVLVERTFQQRAEDGRLDVLPVGLGGEQEHADLLDGEVEGVGFLEQAAVEAQQRLAQARLEAALVHDLPEMLDRRLEAVGPLGCHDLGEQVLEAVSRQQADILGEHGEQAAHQEAGDGSGVVPGLLQALGEFGQVPGDLAGDLGGLLGRV